MHYIWEHGLLLPGEQRTTGGDAVEILDPGLANGDAGPDFFNAKVRIGGEQWCGNVEIHVRASDWYRHGHQNDRAYDSVILHVVEHDDMDVKRSDGEVIAQMVMRYNPGFAESYREMVFGSGGATLPCGREVRELPGIFVTDLLSGLGVERLRRKVDDIMALHGRLDGDWRETVYVTIARAFGFHTNSQPFELTALSTPLRILLKHRGDARTVEALLFGQAGMLAAIPDEVITRDEYVRHLIREYEFMKAKFGLKQWGNIQWKMARMRPQNFPFRRLAALAAMVAEGFSISRRIFSTGSAEEAAGLFEIRLNDYWRRRYGFGGEEARHDVGLFSRESVNTLTINVVVPLMFAYGRATNREDLCGRAVEILEGLPPENNSTVRLFRGAGMACRSAFESQAMLQLKRDFCDARKCLYCTIGHKFLSRKAWIQG